MRCYYDVLCIERNAEGDAIKKAYYRLSLANHPDKNIGRESEVTPIYQEILDAYRVLSDPHERAWYDKHRERILQGGMGGSGVDFKEERIDIYQYFSSSCYHGMTDDETGFYGVYNKVFASIFEEEFKASIDPSANLKQSLPEFGLSNSNYDEVVRKFYANWEVFNSQKTYAWVETHDSRSAPSRRIRRLMEAENKKLRDGARKERNEEVRALVAFVKKRDLRVQEERRRLQAESEQKRAQALNAAKVARARNREQLEEETAVWQANQDSAALQAMERELARLEAHWDEVNEEEVVDNGNAQASADSKQNNSENSSDDPDGFYCPACNKAFLSENSYENHLNSRKHKKQVLIIREQLLAEDPSLNVDELLNFGEGDAHKDKEMEEDKTPKVVSKRAKRNKRREKKNGNQNYESDDSSAEQPNVANELGEESNPVPTVNPPSSVPDSSAEEHNCKVCKENFPTRNKLFSHIKETGHASPKVVSQKPKKTKKSKK